jgi:hypothetical protein
LSVSQKKNIADATNNVSKPLKPISNKNALVVEMRFFNGDCLEVTENGRKRSFVEIHNSFT